MSTFDKAGHQHLSAERLSEYIDGRLPPHEREGVEAQLRACAHCREEVDSLRATVMLLRRVPAVPAPRSFALREAPSPRGGLFSLLGGLRLATAVAAGLLVLVLAGDILRLLPSMYLPSASEAPVAALPVPAAPAEPSEPPQAPREAVRGPSPTAPAQKDQATSLAAAPVAPAATPAVGTLAPSPAPAATVAPAPMRAAAAPSGAAPALSPTPAAEARARAAPAPVSTPTAAAAAPAPPTVAALVETPRPAERAAPAMAATPIAPPAGGRPADVWLTVETALAVVVAVLLVATLAVTWRRARAVHRRRTGD